MRCAWCSGSSSGSHAPGCLLAAPPTPPSPLARIELLFLDANSVHVANALPVTQLRTLCKNACGAGALLMAVWCAGASEPHIRDAGITLFLSSPALVKAAQKREGVAMRGFPKAGVGACNVSLARVVAVTSQTLPDDADGDPAAIPIQGGRTPAPSAGGRTPAPSGSLLMPLHARSWPPLLMPFSATQTLQVPPTPLPPAAQTHQVPPSPPPFASLLFPPLQLQPTATPLPPTLVGEEAGVEASVEVAALAGVDAEVEEVLSLWDIENLRKPDGVSVRTMQRALELVLIENGFINSNTRHRLVAAMDTSHLVDPHGAVRREWSFTREDDMSVQLIDSGPKPEAADHVLRTAMLDTLLKRLKERVTLYGRAGLRSPWEAASEDEAATRDAALSTTGAALPRGRLLVVLITSDGDFLHHAGDVKSHGQRAVIITPVAVNARSVYHGLIQSDEHDVISWEAITARARSLSQTRVMERTLLERSSSPVLRAPFALSRSASRARGNSGGGGGMSSGGEGGGANAPVSGPSVSRVRSATPTRMMSRL